MSSTIAPVYRTEAGVHNHPVVNETIQTRCFDGSNNVTKHFKEVYIYWDGSEWVESPVWNNILSEIKVALRIDNQCTGEYSYIDFRFNDYRLLDLCCIDCPLPLIAAALPQATFDVPYNTTIQIQGSGAYQMSVVDKPDWMTIVLNPTTGVITLSGTPDEVGDVVVQLQAGNCGGGLAPMIEYTLNIAQVLTMQSLAPINSSFWIDIKWVPFLNVWVAITQSGATNRIATSPDLVNWTFFKNSSTQYNRIGIGNGVVMITGTGMSPAGYVRSTDGTTWTDIAAAEVQQSFGIAYSPTLDVWISTNQLGTNKLAKSTDGGLTWTPVVASTLNNHRDVCWSTALSLFIVVATNGTADQVITSPDGDNWTTQVTPGPSRSWQRVKEIPETGRIIAVAGTGATGLRIMYSDDGATWIMSGAIPNLNHTLAGISSAPGIIVATGFNTFSGLPSMIKSVDNGLTWTTLATLDGQWNGLDYGNDLFAAIGINSAGSGSVLASGTWLD